ncbi:hypothetical protein AB1Y20_002955 [Prymnesium parvum]|uniref:Dolichol kinase n=1 Tax=Prymnesium parvum TaxID=97485 RepID=A0AB34JC18_PRYPA
MSCSSALVSSSSGPTLAAAPMLQTLGAVLVILFCIVAQLEIFAVLSKQRWLPSKVSRKLTHIGCGGVMTTALVLFPTNYWPARLAVSLSLVLFMFAFAVVAHLPEEKVQALPDFVRARLDGFVHSMCRHGDRLELMRGTFYYAFAVATCVLLFWTAPVNVIIFSSLFVGDGVADPVGRLVTARLADWCKAAAAAEPSTKGGGAPPAEPSGLRHRGARPRSTDEKSTDEREGGEGKLLPLQYRVGYFGVKSFSGSLAFFGASLLAAFGWASLFDGAGHYGPAFPFAHFMKSAAISIGVATIAEAISPPHVDNLLVTYAAAAVSFCLAESGVAPYLLTTCA